MNPLVLDASIALQWVFEEDAAVLTQRAVAETRRREVLAPAVWPLEVSNGLLVAERQGKLRPAEVDQGLELLSRLRVHVEITPVTVAWHAVMSLARTHHLTTYDASYLELAIRYDAELATADVPLAKAAERERVRLFEKGFTTR